MSNAPHLTLFDRALGAVYAPYKTRAMQHRAAQSGFTALSRRGDTGRKSSGGYTSQPWGAGQIRKLTPQNRRVMVQQSRQVYENNVLGRSLIDRAVDNIIGEGMTVRPASSDPGWNEAVSKWWKNYEADAAGKFDKARLQRLWFTAYLRDGDIGAIMLRQGQLQTIESDFIQSPNNSGDMYGGRGHRPEIVDGFTVGPAGRLRSAHIASLDEQGSQKWNAVSIRNFLFHANLDRANETAVRGTPKLAIARPLLEHIDGTLEAVTIAHRMAASFGILIKKDNPGAAANGLPSLGSSPSAGDINKKYTIQPGMAEYMNPGESIEQLDPKHPVASFESFMSQLVRFAGLSLGLPLELALMDFSKTTYSSARASMEQAYRAFRCEQRMFADGWLNKWYRWRIAKAVNMGEIDGTPPEDYLEHRWFGQRWPYLDPVKDAQGLLASIDAGATTLTAELAERGMTYDEWLEIREGEIERADAAGVPLMHSSSSRDAAGAAPEPAAINNEPEKPEDDEDEDD